LPRRLSLTLALMMSLLAWLPARAQQTGDDPARFFAETGFGISDNRIWNYFDSRGGVATFGFPVSNEFTLLGFPVQIFQRHILQVAPNGVRPMNLLDPDVLPVNQINFATFPTHDPAVATQAPGADAPNYGQAVLNYVNTAVPNQFEGQAVNFRSTYLAAGAGDTIAALEVWGFPTSQPAYDPQNGAFIYQRFQRGFLHYDATTGFTGGILLGDAFKSVLRGSPTPADLAAQAASSPFWAQYDPTKPGALARPEALVASDLGGAFGDSSVPAGPSPSPVGAGKTPSPDYGASIFIWGAPGTTARDLGKLREGGMRWQKTLFQWRFLEPQKGRYDWGEADRIVKASNAQGIKVVARIDFHPAWARSSGLRNFNGPPTNYADFGDFIYAFVDHFKPGSPNGTVDAIELWNEPNLSREWGDAPIGPNSAAEYTNLLCVGHNAAKRASPDVTTITAGLSPTGVNDAGARDDLTYLREMYTAGAGGCFDALGAHGNTQAPSPDLEIGSWKGCDGGANFCTHGSFYFRRVEQLRQVMVDNGDADKQVWLLEFGWTSDTVHQQYSWFRVSEQQKASNVVNAYKYAYDHWQPWIGPMILWNIAAPDWNETREEFWWSVTNPSGSNRPAYDALVAARRSGMLP
jgi:polysaccharide biosynthesis protein PslG